MTVPRQTVSPTWLALAVLVLGAAFVVTVALTLLIRGPFAWHVSQPEFWQGGLEALMLAAAIFAALQWTRLAPPWRWTLLAIPIALYLRRHHVDGVLLISLVYVEALLLLGAGVRRLCRCREQEDWLRNAVIGIAFMSLLLWLAQLAGLGSPSAQRMLAGLILVPTLILGWRLTLAPKLLRGALALDNSGARVWAAVLIAIVLVAFARTNTVADFDSIWYGLRPHRVLVGDHSVFEPLGFASPVHYFPKLYEVLLLPLAAMRENSVVQGATVLFGALLALLAYRMLRRLGVEFSAALAGTAAIWTIPALAAASLGVKPDVLAALLVVAMIWFGWNVSEGRRGDIAWVVCCACLAVSTKLVAIPYVAAAGLGALIGYRHANTPGAATFDREAIAALGLGLVVAALVSSRTWALAGMPTVGPEQLVALWQGLGMELRAPIGRLRWVGPQDWSALPSLFVGWVFDPSRFSHLQITWPSNLWVFAPLIAGLLPRFNVARPRTPWLLLWTVPLMGLALLVGVGFINRGADGNYFIAPIVLASIVGVTLAWRRCERGPLRSALFVVLGLYVSFQFAYVFASASWSVGTRRWDLDFLRPNRDSPLSERELLARHRLDRVSHWLRGQGGTLRMVGLTRDLAGNRLPARYEELADIATSHYDAQGLHDMQRLFACGLVEALLLPEDPTQFVDTPSARAMTDWARGLPSAADRYRDETWRVIDLRGRLPACN